MARSGHTVAVPVGSVVADNWPDFSHRKHWDRVYLLSSLAKRKRILDFPEVWKAEDGSALTLRRLDDSDAEKLIAFVRNLSVSARYFRFGQGDYEPGLDESLRVCQLRHDEGLHVVVLTTGDTGEQIVGSARYVIEPDRSSCEFVIVVADKWGHHGIGHRLMNALLDCAKDQGLQRMVGRILASNRDMLQFVSGLGFAISDSAEGDWIKTASIDL